MKVVYADGTPVPTREERIEKAAAYVSLIVAAYGTYKSVQHLNKCWKSIKETQNG